MLVEYAFPVSGHAKIGRSYKFPLRGRQYDLLADSAGFLCEVRVQLPADGDAYLPAIQETPEGDVKAHITIPSHAEFSSLRQEMRALEGLLAVHGLREICTARVRQTWIPQSKAEAEAIKLTSITIGTGDMRDHPHEPIDPNLLLQSVIAAPEAYASELPMSFYRKGCLDVEQGRFIDAIYDLYFCIETLYGDGHTKNYKVKDAFLASSELSDTIAEELAKFRVPSHESPALQRHFQEVYAGRSVADVVDHLVKLRGQLHHHSLKHPRRWHPDDQFPFKVDALFLQRICETVCLRLAIGHVVTEDVAHRLRSIRVTVTDLDEPTNSSEP